MKENTHSETGCEQKQETVGLECKLSDNITNDEFDVCLRYYEKAIEGRNFHYQNYNTWVNYYSIFTGALFVGYHSIIDKNSGILPCLITLLGYITSICWHLTVKGHYHWMISWIKVVQSYEKELSDMLQNLGQNGWWVYSVYLKSDYNMYHKNISSQKLTSIFTLIVCLAWSVLLFAELTKVDLFVKFVSALEFHEIYIVAGTLVIILLITVIYLVV